MTSLTMQRPMREQVRRLGLAGTALLLTASTATGVVWRLHSTTSHPAAQGTTVITQPVPALPASGGDRDARMASSLTTVHAPLPPQVWLVRTPAQGAQLQQQLADDEATRAQAGGTSLDTQIVAVTTVTQAEGVFRDLDTASLTRTAAGLAPIVQVDLR